jgi:integrase/recombinase XerD
MKKPATIGAVINKFCTHIEASQVPTTAGIYVSSMNHFRDYLQSIDIDLEGPPTLLDADIFVEYPEYLKVYARNKKTGEPGLSSKSLGVYIAAAKKFFDWMVIHDLIEPPNYAESLRYTMAVKEVMKKKTERKPRFPKLEDADLLVQVAGACEGYDSPIKERNIALIHFLYSTGCRAVELFRLKIGDVDMENRSAKVKGKRDKERTVYFDHATGEAMRAYWKARGWSTSTDPVFARHDKGAGSKHKSLTQRSIWNVVNEISDLAGFDRGKFTTHLFRHAFAIRVLKETGNAPLVQDLLGHTNANVTRIYAQIYDDDKRDAYRKVFD